MQKAKPQLVAIQMDPMHYLYNMRQFASENVHSIKQRKQQVERGIFDEEMQW